MNTKEKIIELSNERYKLMDSFYDSDYDTYPQNIEEKINELSKKILTLLKENIDSLDFEFMMVQLTEIGDCPSLIYDDNGHWAISYPYFSNVSGEDKPINTDMAFYIKEDSWKDSPKEALKFYLHKD